MSFAGADYVHACTPLGLAFIARREGLVTVPYPDGRFLSIGFGHNGPDVTPDRPEMTVEEAFMLLRGDIGQYERGVNNKLNLRLKVHRFDALVSAAYNLGVNGINGVLELVNERKFSEAMDELEKRCKVKVGNNFEVSPGLQRRRARERKMFEEGDYGEVTPIPCWRGNPHVVDVEWVPFPGL